MVVKLEIKTKRIFLITGHIGEITLSKKVCHRIIFMDDGKNQAEN